MKVWITRMKRDPRFFKVSKHTRICSEHFLPSDFKELDVQKRHLKKDAVPSVFSWTETSVFTDMNAESSTIKKLDA